MLECHINTCLAESKILRSTLRRSEANHHSHQLKTINDNYIFRFCFANRNKIVHDWVNRIDRHDGGLDAFSQAYKYYGLHYQQDGSVVAREWAPGAVQVYLTGDFSKYKLVAISCVVLFCHIQLNF